MKKIGKVTLIIVSLIIVLISLSYFGLIKLPFFSVTPTSGAQFIKNTADPNSPYTLTTQASSYTCDADECIVSGSVNFNKGVLIGQNIPATPNGAGSYCCVEGTKTICSNRAHYCSQQITSYGGTFNFCPSSNSNFPYCTGSTNSISSTSAQVGYTDEYKLSRGATVTFNPKNLDNSDVSDKYIRIAKYDLSCLPAIETGSACSPGMIYCKPIITTTSCPSGTYENSACQQDFGRPCFDGNSIGANHCFNKVPGVTDYTKYLKCEATKKIGESTCYTWGTTSYSATSPMQCFVTATNKVGEGIGGLKCPTDSCTFGQKTGTTGSNSYKECINQGSCNAYVDKNCPNGLVFDSGTNNCVFPSSNSCSPQSSECVGTNNIRNCASVTISGLSGYQWQSATPCLGEFTCDNKGTSAFDDSCNCKNVDSCTKDAIQCTSKTAYNVCSKDPNNVNSCLKYRNLGNKVENTEIYECRDNKIQEKLDIGCAYNTVGYICSNLKDSRNIALESCINNECVKPADKYSATETNYLSQTTKCDGQSILYVKRYTEGTKSFYRYEIKTDADNSNNGVCNSEFICRESNGKASCLPNFDFVGIQGNTSFGVNENIAGLKVIVTSNVPNNNNIQITARILENGNEISGTRVNTITDSNGISILNFNYKHPRTAELTVEVIAGNPATSTYKTTKTISVAKRLEVKLTCPPFGYVNRDITCSWKFEDSETSSVIIASSSIKLTQGNSDVPYSPSSNSITFKTAKTGSINLIVTGSADGYISNNAQIILDIQNTEITQSFLVDNKDLFSYGNTGVSTGAHQLSFKVEESGNAVEVQSITGNLLTPSGQEVPITFMKQNNVWITTYNLAQPGQTYRLSGTIVFKDVAKQSIPFEYSITTLQSTTEDLGGQYTLIIIGSAVGLILIIITIVVIVFLRRKS